MRKNKIIYLDNAATMPVYKEVVNEMKKFHLMEYGNPSSTHEMGEKAQKVVNEARKKLALEINAKIHEVILTSGSTESNNLAFFGLARSMLGKKKIIISTIEHSCIFEICDALKKDGFQIIEIPVDKEGILNIPRLEKEIDDSVLLVSIIHVNNEIGVIQDIEKIGEICKSKDVIFHSDCAQSFGKIKMDVQKMGIDLLSAGAHKIGGPKGIGFLYISSGIELEPLIYGGGQERGLRGGTENVPGIIGFGKALDLVKKVDQIKTRKMRDYFFDEIEKIGGKINGSKDKRIYNNVNVSFSGIDAEQLVIYLSQKGIMCSAGSSCDTKKQKESKVLREIGLSDKEMRGSVRMTLSERITKKDIDFVVSEIRKAFGRLRI